MLKIVRDMPLRSYVFALTLAVALGSLLMGMGTADPQLTDATGQVTDYFSANIGTIIGAVVAIAVFVWLLRVAFHSFGVRKVRSVD